VPAIVNLFSPQHYFKVFLNTRGADKSLARPGRKEARKHARDARDFNDVETRTVIKLFFLQGKAPKEIHAILTETLACLLPGRAKDLSAPLYYPLGHNMISKVAGLSFLSGLPHVCYKKTMQKSNNRRNKDKTKNHIYRIKSKPPKSLKVKTKQKNHIYCITIKTPQNP